MFGRSLYLATRTSRSLLLPRRAPSLGRTAAEPMLARLATKSKPPPEFQEAIDAESGRTYYYNLETGQSQWDPPATGYYPAGSGVDRSPLLTAMASDRLSANPFAKPGKWTMRANYVMLVFCTISISHYIYRKYIKEPADEQDADAAAEATTGPASDSK